METNTLNSGAEISTNVTVELKGLVACGGDNSKNKIIRIITMKRHSEHNKNITLLIVLIITKPTL